LAYGPVKLQGEYINTKFDDPAFERDINSWYASAVWNITGEMFSGMYKDGVFGRLKPTTKLGADGWGALQVGLRYTKFDASDFRSTNANGTGVLLNNPAGTAEGLLVATNEADSWTLGANWILNPNARLVANYTHTDFATPITLRVNGVNSTQDSEDAITLAFDKTRADDRKAWLMNYNKNQILKYEDRKVSYYDFVHLDLKHFSNDR
jgi:phosphate-selective porin OprO/OprP